MDLYSAIQKRNGVSESQENRVPIPLIDAHHHLWNLDTHHYPWLKDNIDPHFFLGDYSTLRAYNYLPQDYLADSRSVKLLGTVHCEAEHDRNRQVEETRWVSEQYERYGFPNAIVPHVWFHEEQCETILKKHLAFPLVRGIRSKPVTTKSPEEKSASYGAAGSMQDKAWLRGFSLLEKYGLSWDLRIPYWHLDEAAIVARAFPDTNIVLNHTGFPWDRSALGLKAWREAMQCIADCPNVWVKISELGLKDAPWRIEDNRIVVQDTLTIFGIERCMFASNFPVSGIRISYRDYVYAMLEILKDYTEAEKEAFFWKNAQEFYRINL